MNERSAAPFLGLVGIVIFVVVVVANTTSDSLPLCDIVGDDVDDCAAMEEADVVVAASIAIVDNLPSVGASA